MEYVAIYLFFSASYAGAVYGHYDMGSVAENWPTRITIYTAMFVTEGLIWPIGFAVDVFRFFMPKKGNTVRIVNSIQSHTDTEPLDTNDELVK